MNNRPQPPALALRLLKWFCKPYYLEIIEGDLFEIYERQLRHSRGKAKMSFYWNTIRFFRLRYIKNVEDIRPKSSIGMLKNYFKVTIRNMRKQMAYTTFNLLGLSVGTAACLLIIVHLSAQLKYDKFVPEGEHVYRVINVFDKDRYGSNTPAQLVKFFLQDYPEIATGTRVAGTFDAVLRNGDEYITQDGGIIADSTFFEVFPTTFLHGEPKNALNAPSTLVLTESMAEKFFPDQNAMGQTLVYNGDPYQVTAVVSDPPATTTMPYKFIMNIPFAFWATQGYWTGNNFYSYVKLHPEASTLNLENKFPDFVRRYIAPEMLSFMSEYESWEEYLDDGNFRSFKLIPLFDIHLHYPRFSLGAGGSYENVILFGIIAFFILFIACINYVNMATARSTVRAKEVGMRKVLGSLRNTLIQQFLLESIFITLISVLLGLVLAIVALPFFNSLTGTAYEWTAILSLSNLLWVGAIIIVIGLLAGSYPALFLSSFQPIVALRGLNVKGGSSKLRTGLVILQFAISAFLITATFIVYSQVQHMSARKLGVNTSEVFVLRNTGRLGDQFETFQNILEQQTGISQVSALSTYPSGSVPDWGYGTKGENRVQLGPDHIFADKDAAEVLGLIITEGTFFQGIATDTGHVVVNETFVRKAGWDNPIGELVDRGRGENYRVIGVVQDFVMRTAKRNPRELIFRYNPDGIRSGDFGGPYLLIKMTGNYREQLAIVEEEWNKFSDGYPFDGMFLDESFNRLYQSERRFGQLFTTFSGLAILIACIGLFALAAFTLEKRLKEIAIRKVLGATVNKVVRIIVWDFLKLTLMGAVIAIPVIYYLGNDWLSNYDYRISIGPVILLVPIFVIVAISLLTISLKTWHTAIDNPVNALKQE